jgi:hypothetical protein
MALPQLSTQSLHVTTSVELTDLPRGNNATSAMLKSEDEQVLAHFGKRQQLRVRLYARIKLPTLLIHRCSVTSVSYPS